MSPPPPPSPDSRRHEKLTGLPDPSDLSPSLFLRVTLQKVQYPLWPPLWEDVRPGAAPVLGGGGGVTSDPVLLLWGAHVPLCCFPISTAL